ncbi:MAG: imidazole glycerol phosphate synthase subunit HisH [Pseudolabrys sp.]
MKLVIVNSGVGNVRSVANMLKRLGVECLISDRPKEVEQAGAIIVPGVGSYDAAIRRFRETGLRDALDAKARGGTTPMIGICLGMQLMGDYSEEGDEPGFGWIGGSVKRFDPASGGEKRLRVPHMGWNLVKPEDGSLFAGLDQPPRYYFDHSYYFTPTDAAHYGARTTYGVEFASGIRKGLLFGVQFHPEKSHRFGFQLFSNFVALAKAHVAALEVQL